MKTFTLKDPKPMGDEDPKYGQTYWSYTHDGDLPVMFNLMNDDVGDGSIITCEEWVNKQSAKGTEYMRLKKVKVSDASAPLAKPQPDGSKFQEIVLNELSEIKALLRADAATAKIVNQKVMDDVVEDIGDEPINLNDIPF